MDEDKFTEMLLELQNGIKPEELEPLKFMCEGKISKRKLDEIDSVIGLWTVLKEADVINRKDTSFLEKLLQRALKNRVDLQIVYDRYTNTTKPLPNSTNAGKYSS